MGEPTEAISEILGHPSEEMTPTPNPYVGSQAWNASYGCFTSFVSGIAGLIVFWCVSSSVWLDGFCFPAALTPIRPASGGTI